MKFHVLINDATINSVYYFICKADAISFEKGDHTIIALVPNWNHFPTQFTLAVNIMNAIIQRYPNLNIEYYPMQCKGDYNIDINRRYKSIMKKDLIKEVSIVINHFKSVYADYESIEYCVESYCLNNCTFSNNDKELKSIEENENHIYYDPNVEIVHNPKLAIDKLIASEELVPGITKNIIYFGNPLDIIISYMNFYRYAPNKIDTAIQVLSAFYSTPYNAWLKKEFEFYSKSFTDLLK